VSELFEFCQCNFDGVPASSLVSFGNRQMGVRVSMENSDRRFGCVLEQFYEIYFFLTGDHVFRRGSEGLKGSCANIGRLGADKPLLLRKIPIPQGFWMTW